MADAVPHCHTCCCACAPEPASSLSRGSRRLLGGCPRFAPSFGANLGDSAYNLARALGSHRLLALTWDDSAYSLATAPATHSCNARRCVTKAEKCPALIHRNLLPFQCACRRSVSRFRTYPSRVHPATIAASARIGGRKQLMSATAKSSFSRSRADEPSAAKSTLRDSNPRV